MLGGRNGVARSGKYLRIREQFAVGQFVGVNARLGNKQAVVSVFGRANRCHPEVAPIDRCGCFLYGCLDLFDFFLTRHDNADGIKGAAYSR